MRRAAYLLVGLAAACGGADDTLGPDAGDDAGAITATRYPSDVVRTPVTPSVAARVRAIAAAGPAQRDAWFAKVGDSHTVNPNLLSCFTGAAPWMIDLAGRDDLAPTIARFAPASGGTGESPFDRTSLAAMIGKTARWAITAVPPSPSPLDQELAAITPRFAFVNYGTNDMQQGTTYASALPPFVDSMNALLDRLEAAGVVPIVVGLTPRSDLADAARWVPTYDDVTRALAEARQLPYVSLLRATEHLPGLGVVSDGVHGNSYYVGGVAQPCILTAAGLMYTYNQRNLHYLDALAASWPVVAGDPAPDADALPPVAGSGTAADPFVIDRLPFTHTFDTRGGERLRDGYPDCDAGQDESGPEIVYRLALDAATPVRAIVLDRAGVDVDVHVLAGEQCLERGDHLVDRTLAAGDATIVVDTFVAAGVEQAGAYTLVVAACEPGDPDC